jgi:hypothetical protein
MKKTFIGLVLAIAAAGAARAADMSPPQLTTQYGLESFRGGIPTSAEGFYAGGAGLASFAAGTATNVLTDPATGTQDVSYASADGTLVMSSFAFGQPVEAQISQYALGDVIPPPPGVPTDGPPLGFVPVQVGENRTAYYRNDSGSAIWLPSRQVLVAAAGGNVEIAWPGISTVSSNPVVTTNDAGVVTNWTTVLSNTVVYTVSSVPTNRPARLYWTESPYNAPEVYMQAGGGSVFPVLHYNNYVPEPEWELVTNSVMTNYTSGVWLDGPEDSQCLRAIGAEGILLLEYYATGDYTTSIGLQPVQVMGPVVEEIKANVGDRLLPRDRYYGTDDLTAKVTAGIGGGNSDTLFVVDDGNSFPKKRNWLYALRATAGTPWNAEVYWEHKDARGVVWPFEVDWYDIDWPVDIIRIPVDAASNGVPALLPGALAPEIKSQALLETPKKESANAVLDPASKALSFEEPGYALLKYASTQDLWFEPVKAVAHDDPGEYDQTVQPWVIGREILPSSEENYVLDLDGKDDYAEGTQTVFDGTGRPFTVEAWAWIRAGGGERPVVSFYAGGDDTSADAWELGFTNLVTNSVPYFMTPRGTVTASRSVPTNEWHHLAGVSTSNALLLYLDGNPVATNDAPSAASEGTVRRHIQIGRTLRTDAFFAGRIDEVRYWSVARSAKDIRAAKDRSIRKRTSGLLECYPMDEGGGRYIADIVDGSFGTVYGSPKWLASYHLASTNVADLEEYPGYIHAGSAYNVETYQYPEEWEEAPRSSIFAVNKDDFEIWWAKPSAANASMPAAVHYPSLVQRYKSAWPTNAPAIAVGSDEGSGPLSLAGPRLYVQNDPEKPGYNPNEEHALLLGNTLYALCDDLNTTNSSEPFVLVTVAGADGRPDMATFRLERASQKRDTKAGAAVAPPVPLTELGVASGTKCVSGPGWQDRKDSWWAKAAGDDGGKTNIVMQFYYRMQPTFCFPALDNQPSPGTPLPWLPSKRTKPGGTEGTPTNVVYGVTWPENVPEMAVAQTLAEASGGLPDIWNQASVDIIYQQSATNGHGDSVVLYDPAAEKSADLPKEVVDSLVAAGKARKETTGNRYRFVNLSPSLEERLYYDPARGADGRLVLSGMLRAPLVGDKYVLPNWISHAEHDDLLALGDGLSATSKSAWRTAVGKLPVDTASGIPPNAAYVNAALSSAPPTNAAAHGYVTLAFNQSTNVSRVPEALPVSLQVIRVSTNLFGSQYLDVIEPDNPLEEKLTLVYPDDFGGEADNYEFEWRWNVPVAGREPETSKDQWSPYFMTPTATSNGAVSLTIESGGEGGAGELFMLSDHWFAVRYRRADGLGPTGTNWSPWVSTLAEGWIERVMTALNPFEQRVKDMADYAPGLGQTMIEQCGGPYEGPVALDEASVETAGLIQIYQTVMDRALSLSLEAGLADSNCNDSLLFAATRLNKLYMVLGNEAYADALDPTVAIDPGTGEDGWYQDYSALDTSLFCFQNQVSSLLEEELALLRGRDDSGTTPVTVTPVYNRLMWNYTHGIDGGEVAYVCNYDLHGIATNTAGDISAEDAKRLFPQGHGDAWGHYLSALAPYYTLLSHTNFGWNTIPGATLVGNATVGVDYFDEESFAAAAAAKARTGAGIVSLTARRDYAFGAKGLERWHPDADTNRCWDVDGWAVRAGQGAYFDWAVANSLLLDTVTNRAQVGGGDAPASGLDAIDRDHAPAISEISSSLSDIQLGLDRANAGLNPLGLDENAIPFDISAAELDAGKGHFEQVYERALGALRNAKTAFSAAQDASVALRKQYDSAYRAVSAAQQEEIAYKNRLIEIYGYPYADDIGPGGTYAQGYDGPDLVNYMVLDLDETLGPAPVAGVAATATVQLVTYDAKAAATYYDVHFWTNALGKPGNAIGTASNAFIGSDGIIQGTDGTVTLVRSFNSLGLRDKPPAWTGRRRSQGEIQAAMYDFVESYYSFLKAQNDLEKKQVELDNEYTIFQIDAGIGIRDLQTTASVAHIQYIKETVKAAMEVAYEMANIWADGAEMTGEGVAADIPNIIAGVFPAVEENVSGAIKVASVKVWTIARMIALGAKTASEGTIAGEEKKILDLERQISMATELGELQKSAIQLLEDAKDQYALIRELHARLTSMDAALERVLSLESEGERTLANRAMSRNRIAQRLEGARYVDMLYRTFRTETLANYAGLFDIAARYAWQAAMAYDYETGLLDPRSGNSAAARFLSGIVRARTLGRIADGLPLTAPAEGDGGLADALARLKADWDAVKPRYGLNNPDSATTRFSLRKELFRISPAAASDTAWADALSACRVDDLNAVDAYRRYCVPYGGASTNAEPGLVIPFAGSIVARCNFFGKPAGGGDNFYDPTWLSTRIRAVGVWFGGYNATFNTNNAAGAGLVNTPNVYLVPAGTDTIVTGTDRTRTSLRTWTVLDQVLPLPVDIGQTDTASGTFLPLRDSLAGTSAERRRHSAFRAHHDAGNFTEAELCTNARLVGRSVWNTDWVLIIPGSSLLSDPAEGLDRFIHGALQPDSTRDGHGITDIRLYFKTYSYSGD